MMHFLAAALLPQQLWRARLSQLAAPLPLAEPVGCCAGSFARLPLPSPQQEQGLLAWLQAAVESPLLESPLEHPWHAAEQTEGWQLGQPPVVLSSLALSSQAWPLPARRGG